ncbi:hypothetical protein [Cohnella lupini]|uniref:Uncharacterized protein n=1 Tax=Cohnella lupini TaxID=1294267 RepID=A0A3D9IX98_9BACL|nr:hypothetical protein [Cohnella lupini]RED66129.1 hypothetical protein DFP95_101627 [Cohnella lupini]
MSNIQLQSQLDLLKGSLVTEINPLNPIIIFNEEADGFKSLVIESAWRLTKDQEILIGYYEYNHEQTKQLCINNFKEYLIGKRILNIDLNEIIGDISIKFEGDLKLELFHTSSMFEGWQLYGENGFLLLSLPGGRITYTE